MRLPSTLLAAALLTLAVALVPRTAAAIDVGDNVKVSWQGQWHKAVVRDIAGTRLRVHYVGYGKNHDDWISMGQVAIQVRWKGQWYPATVMKSGSNKVKIHYTGYDSSWDEWVPLSRIASVGGGAVGPGVSRAPTRAPARVPSHIRESARDVPSDPTEFLRAIERNSR